MRSSLIILAFFALGLALGISNWFPGSWVSANAGEYALYFLMLIVGVGIGADPNSLVALKALSFRILLVPIATIVGTTMGVALVWLVFSTQTFSDTIAVGYGFGYYSLSSIFISQARGETLQLGIIALLANIIREFITLLLAPMFALYFGKLAPIAAGGATSMDTTLPIITKASGKEYAIVSLFHGIVLTVLVPFLVSLVLNYF